MVYRRLGLGPKRRRRLGPENQYLKKTIGPSGSIKTAIRTLFGTNNVYIYMKKTLPMARKTSSVSRAFFFVTWRLSRA